MRARQIDTKIYVARVFVGTFDIYTGTTIPTSTNPVGDYTTKLVFQQSRRDDLGTVIDLANSRMNIPAGFGQIRISYNLAWASNATGWRGCRVKNSAGSNYGNVRIPSVGASTTTNNNYVSPWITIQDTNDAPEGIAVGSYFELYPAQTSGGDLVCGADAASSWFQVEIRR